mmetsp:Transcript_7608/g.19313  ORF Transcript_7608/g.19313 Transcript_7608/m.19313 type:complete len:202 (-) Transcript_7608:837-1442(-)
MVFAGRGASCGILAVMGRGTQALKQGGGSTQHRSHCRQAERREEARADSARRAGGRCQALLGVAPLLCIKCVPVGGAARDLIWTEPKVHAGVVAGAIQQRLAALGVAPIGVVVHHCAEGAATHADHIPQHRIVCLRRHALHRDHPHSMAAKQAMYAVEQLPGFRPLRGQVLREAFRGDSRAGVLAVREDEARTGEDLRDEA